MSYDKLTKKNLISKCIENKLQYKSKMRKDELINLLVKNDSSTKDVKELNKTLSLDLTNGLSNVTDEESSSSDSTHQDELPSDSTHQDELPSEDNKLDIDNYLNMTKDDNKIDSEFMIKKFEYQDKIIKLLFDEIQILKTLIRNGNGNGNVNCASDEVLKEAENIIDDGFYNDEFSILKDKKNLTVNETIDTINQLYKIGITFENILDANCYDNSLIKYITEKHYECKGLSLYKATDDYILTDINISSIKDQSYNIVICFNLFEYLTNENIYIYYKNLIRVSNNFIIIKINDISKGLDFYLDIFNRVVNDQKIYEIQRYITKNLPQNLFILKKDFYNKHI